MDLRVSQRERAIELAEKGFVRVAGGAEFRPPRQNAGTACRFVCDVHAPSIFQLQRSEVDLRAVK